MEDYEEGIGYDEDEQACEEVEDEIKAIRGKVITPESLAQAQGEALQLVAETFMIKRQHARSLLIFLRWNVSSVFDRLNDLGKDKLFRLAGLTSVEYGTQEFEEKQAAGATQTCQICFDDAVTDESTEMECGHVFCNECWVQGLSIKIMEGQSRRLTCMAPKCGAICDEEKVRRLLSSELRQRYDRSLLESFVEDNSMVKWCPSVPHCGNAIEMNDDGYYGELFYDVQCACSHEFCFSCTEASHSPCTCEMLKRWKLNDADMVWITAHTITCPKCHNPVEKDTGCNHITCRCGQYFCYLCGGATGFLHTTYLISGHTCVRYNGQSYEKQAKSKAAAKTYLEHYYKRYTAHLESMKLEELNGKKMLKDFENQLVADYDWVRMGIQTLVHARRVLAYSYAFAYLMFVENFRNEASEGNLELNKTRFEDYQEQFDKQLERLSSLMKKDIVLGSRYDVLTATQLLKTYRKNLFDLVENDLLAEAYMK